MGHESRRSIQKQWPIQVRPQILLEELLLLLFADVETMMEC
jgi:hypothetical protein